MYGYRINGNCTSNCPIMLNAFLSSIILLYGLSQLSLKVANQCRDMTFNVLYIQYTVFILS